MRIIVIGSVALNFRGVSKRTPRDFDVICSFDDFKELVQSASCRKFYPIKNAEKMVAVTESGKIYEAEITWDDSLAAEFMQLVLTDPETMITGDFIYPSLNALYVLKMSHRYLRNSPAFLKTMQDIREMRYAGAWISSRYEDWYKRREKATYYYDHPNLNVKKDEFFDKDESFYKYDHDDIHEAVKIGQMPAYKYFIADGAQVKCDKDKFEVLTEQTKLNAVLEESMVLALERSQIPNNFKVNPRRSFMIALEKVCTSITSGWFREYAWENYDVVVDMYDENYVSKFQVALAEGKIGKFQGKY